MKFIKSILLSAIFISVTSCSFIQRQFDSWSLSGVRDEISKGYSPGNPEELKIFTAGFSLEKETRPVYHEDVKSSKLDRWLLDQPRSFRIEYDKLSFPSLVDSGSRRDTAYFYVYKKGDLKNRNVILFVPGFRVTDIAFKYLSRFFYDAIERDYDVLMYVPPFHLDRKIPGKDDGDGFFSSNTLANIKLMVNMVREIRTIVKYLEQKGVKSISAWGGSMGAASVLVSSSMIKYRHIAVMIPVVDWGLVAVENKVMSKVKARLARSGFDEELLRKSYSLVSPVMYRPLTPPEKIYVQYALLDQLIDGKYIRLYAEKYGIKRIDSYMSSHSTVLLYSQIYSDYADFLDGLKE